MGHHTLTVGPQTSPSVHLLCILFENVACTAFRSAAATCPLAGVMIGQWIT